MSYCQKITYKIYIYMFYNIFLLSLYTNIKCNFTLNYKTIL